MKALAMLDHVMLWVARVFALLIFWATAAHPFAAKHSTGSENFGFTIKAIFIITSLICVFCTFFPSYFISRLFLSMGSLLILISVFVGALMQIRLFNELSAPLGISLIILVEESIVHLVGAAAFLWIAYRPSQNSINLVIP